MPVRTVSWTVLGLLAVGAVLLFNYWASFQPLSTLAYAGIVAAIPGLANLVFPFRFLGIRRRSVGALVLVAGMAVTLAALFWPARTIHVAQPRSRLDQVLPEYQFSEKHSVRVHARPPVVIAAVRASTWSDMHSLNLLLRIRGALLRTPRSEGGAFAPDQRIMDTFAASAYLLESSQREVLLCGLINLRERSRPEVHSLAEIADYREPGALKQAFDFTVEDEGSGWSRLTTETRMAIEGGLTRGPAVYWRLIVPGSGLLRREWLSGIKKRAESGL